MGKGQKSSATSGTRKKNARKAAQAAQESAPNIPSVPKQSKPKDGKHAKLSKRQAREQHKKVYIPPTKPAPPVLDPLDTTGLAHLLPPELVVVLRSLGKKDAITRGKAIEELAKWVEDAIKEEAARDHDHNRYEQGSGKADIVINMLPVWYHRAPVLFTHPARRVRYLAASLHLSLLRLAPAREAFFAWIGDAASQDEMETLLGTWAMLAHDIDRGVTTVGMKSWADFVTIASSLAAVAASIKDEKRVLSQPQHTRSQPKITLDSTLLIALLRFAQHTVLNPQGLHTSLNPAPVVNPSLQQGHRSLLQGKNAQGKGTIQSKKGSTTPQSHQKKTGRYVPPPSEPSLPDSTSEQTSGDGTGEESDSDRAGRLRVGALGVIKWILENWPEIDSISVENLSSITSLLSSPALWSTLHPATVPLRSDLANDQGCPFSVASFGQGQPHVRQAAWALAGSLIAIFEGGLPGTLIRILSTAILRSAWVETDIGVRAALGGPLIVFLKDHSQAWMVDMENASRGYNNLHADARGMEGDELDSDSDSDSEPDSEIEIEDDSEAADPSIKSPSKEQLVSEAYTEFLRFLELGCSGSPVEGYPLVLVVLVGIPSSILPTALPPSVDGQEGNKWTPSVHTISQLFTSLWSPLDAGLLSKRTAALSWLKAVGECLVLIIRRGVHADSVTPDTYEDANNFLASQFSRLWNEIVTKRLRVDEIEAAEIIAGAAERLGKIREDLFDAPFDAFCSAILDSIPVSPNTRDIAPLFLHFFTCTFTSDTRAGQKTRGIVEIYTRRVIDALETALDTSEQTLVASTTKDPFAALVKLMDTFGTSLFDDRPLTSRIDAIFITHPVKLLRMSMQGILAWLRHRSKSSDQSQGESQTQAFWMELLGKLALPPTNTTLPLLSPLVDASLPTHLRGTNPAMDRLVEHLVHSAITAGIQGDEQIIVMSVLGSPEPFISSHCLSNIASILLDGITTFAEANVRFAGTFPSEPDGVPQLVEVNNTVGLLKNLTRSGYEFTREMAVEVYVGVFLLGYVRPRAEVSGSKWVGDAKALWISWTSRTGDLEQQMREVAGSLVKEKLKNIILDEKVDARPEYIIQCITPPPPGIRIEPLRDILPSCEEFDAMLESPSLPFSTTSPSLALLDSTLPTVLDTPAHTSTTWKKYTRAVSALFTFLAASRTVARSNLWALRHILVFSFYANECLRVDDGPALFDVTRDHLKDAMEKVKSLTTYLLCRAEDGMHAKVINALTSRDSALTPEDGTITSFVISVVRHAKENDRVRDAAVLGIVLQHLFSDATKDDADLWLSLARRLEKTAPQTSITILASMSAHALEPPKFDRYRNELAASLVGIRPNAAATNGLVTLRLLAATAPLPDSDVIFLPQQRAVNVMKACQAWVAADEDDGDGVDEDVEGAMTLVFFHIAPILQNVPGSHWDFIWDVIENNLENCSLEDSSTLTTLGRTLKLVIAIDDLASTNKPLRAGWDERKSTVFRLTRDLVSVNTNSMPHSEPRGVCRELALSIIQDMPSTMMDENTLPSMCHLLINKSQEVQRTGYHLLTGAARRRTEHYVIEAGVDTEDVVKPELPLELLVILQQSLGSGEVLDLDEQSTARNKDVSGHLLAWMVAFDLFADASMKVRSSYFNHMRSLDIISRCFIPNIFDILGLFSGGKQMFKLDMWAVDGFYLQTFEPESPLSLQLLAAHLFHRALLTVPALIRSWISDCTDKQLLARVTDYTSSYFSPGIIKAELSLIRQPDTSSELLTTENLTVKVSSASGEATVSYSVDDQALELSIRMPNDWPLHRLEVRDTKMVGVSEDRWRAWVLGVQQIVWQQNCRIVDGLTLFAKNVALHFSGQVECAICYSIISVMDSTLPQKPCKTCKNRFHASCLYKWFKTSHSSSCPLCRSDIL